MWRMNRQGERKIFLRFFADANESATWQAISNVRFSARIARSLADNNMRIDPRIEREVFGQIARRIISRSSRSYKIDLSNRLGRRKRRRGYMHSQLYNDRLIMWRVR